LQENSNDLMTSYRRTAIIVLILGVVLLFALFFRTREDHDLFDPRYKVELVGNTMGTFYSIKYLDKETRDFQVQIDSLLRRFNQSLSTYDPDSEISRFNRQDTLRFESPFFLPVLEASLEVYKITGGAFDPTVMPLVNAWGFGPEKRRLPDAAQIDSLIELVGFNKVAWDKEKVYKLKPNVQLDFSAVAKGYGVDVVADFLIGRGIRNLMVEIGGEVVSRGRNENGDIWRIGITNPLPTESRGWLYAAISLENKAIATSGNYMNFYEEGGNIISHTISPFTGYPVRHELLSATVMANDCMTADAFATAFMVLGVEKSRELLKEHQHIEGYLIYAIADDKLDSYFTPGLKKVLREVDSPN
jgi:FAD:protein FMN transferase